MIKARCHSKWSSKGLSSATPDRNRLAYPGIRGDDGAEHAIQHTKPHPGSSAIMTRHPGCLTNAGSGNENPRARQTARWVRNCGDGKRQQWLLIQVDHTVQVSCSCAAKALSWSLRSCAAHGRGFCDARYYLSPMNGKCKRVECSLWV